MVTGEIMKKFERMVVDEKVKLFTDEIWCNDKYQVNIKQLSEGWTWLSIKRKDKEVIKDWRDLQLIKNMLCGEEREGLELYPAESRLVDSSNQFHLFVMPEDQRFIFGYKERLVVGGRKGGWRQGAGQRDWKLNEMPKDVISPKEADNKVNDYLKN